MSRHLTMLLCISVIAIWIVWGAFLLTNPDFLSSKEDSNPFAVTGSFGDSFGILASLMSTLALIGAIYSVHVQGRNYERQQFESNFYKLIDNLVHEKSLFTAKVLSKKSDASNLHEKASYFKLKNKLRRQTITFHGDEAFQVVLYRIRDQNGPNNYSDTKIVARNYRKVTVNAVRLRKFFRLSYHILKLIDRSPVKDNYYYASILRAHLSQIEFCLIAYNCAIDEGRAKFKPLIEKYAFLHNLKNQNLDDYERAELSFFQRNIDASAFRFEVDDPVVYR